MINKNNFFILTGAMGAGKSTLLQELIALQFKCIEEPARPIIAEQRSIEGNGVFEKDPKLFIELMLSRAMYQYRQMEKYDAPVIFDRGIPDLIGYANLARLKLEHVHLAAQKFRYHNIVFFTPAWKEIYRTDDERKMTFDEANQFGKDLKNIYIKLGYQIVDVPFDIPEIRSKFIAREVAELTA